MECNVCLEAFDSNERRPKVLPCGHSFCLRCLLGLQVRRCPLDNKEFSTPPSGLPDNFSLTQLRSVDASLRFWCQSCEKVATQECVEQHSICSLRKARATETEQLLEALQRGEAAVDKLTKHLELLEFWRDDLETHMEYVLNAKNGLCVAQGADEATWEAAKQDAARAGLPRDAVQLLSALDRPATTCSLTVNSEDASWTCEVRPAEDAYACILLCYLVLGGAPWQQQPAEPQAAQLWQERSNKEREMTVQEMAAAMVVGSRVGPGRDWPKTDITPPALGTVTRKVSSTKVYVKWADTGETAAYAMGYNGKYQLQLLAPAMVPFHVTLEDVLDMSTLCDSAFSLEVLKKKYIAQVVGMQCISSPDVCLKVLEHCHELQSLQMVSPQQQHMDAALALPDLEALSIINVTGPQLQQVSQALWKDVRKGQPPSLRRLEIHCPFDAPLFVLTPLTTPALLRFLRLGVHPLAVALDLVRAQADTLQELQLVAASTEPYGCPDLAEQLRGCGLKKLKRMVLLRHDAYDALCRHDKESCPVQIKRLWEMFARSKLSPTLLCSVCDRVV